ncbi:MAG: hypothetical protein V4506_02360 [Bacteroidota bacterium]
MSNQFSYELDERQIRLMLQDGELEYDSSAWNRFEQAVQPEFKPQTASLVSKLNLSISRSVIVPGTFILLIGGLSAMLFSFVDFKKKDQAITKPIVQAADNQLPVKTAVTKQTAIPAKKETVTLSANEQEHKAAIITPSVNTTPAIVKKEETVTVSKPETKIVPSTPPVKDNTLTLATEKKKEVMPVPAIKRKRKKETSEEIPTINTSSTLLNSTTTDEPELELK